MAQVKLAYNDYDGAQALAEQAIAADPKKRQCALHHWGSFGQQDQQSRDLLEDGYGQAHPQRVRSRTGTRSQGHRLYGLLMEFHKEAPGMVGGDKKKVDEYQKQMLQADQVVGNLKLAEAATNLKQWDKVESYYKTALAADPKAIDHFCDWVVFIPPMQGAKNTIWRKSWHVMAIKLDPSRSGGYFFTGAALGARQPGC